MNAASCSAAPGRVMRDPVLQIAISVRLPVLKETQVPPRGAGPPNTTSQTPDSFHILIFYRRFFLFFLDHFFRVPALPAPPGITSPARSDSPPPTLSHHAAVETLVLAVRWCSSTPPPRGGPQEHRPISGRVTRRPRSTRCTRVVPSIRVRADASTPSGVRWADLMVCADGMEEV